jgi:hypothetical protein
MAKPKVSLEDVAGSGSVTGSQLADALVLAINAAKPPQKKTVADRVPQTPWTAPPGVPKLKLKRKIYQHGIPVREEFLTNERIALCNKIRPGVYCDGWVKVIRRHDKGLNIDYPVRSPQQRLKLVSVFGIRNFTELLQRLITEAETPKKSEFDLTDE